MRIAPFLELIDTLGVDVTCCQELTRYVASEVRKAMPWGDLCHDRLYRGVGIAAKRPVEVTRFSMPKRDGWSIQLEPPDWPQLQAPINIVNVHILGPHLWPYFPNPLRRSHQLRALFAHLDRFGETPFAVLGDFNASPSWPFYKKMAMRYQDAAAKLTPQADPEPTWPNWPRLGVSGLLRIDHCFLAGLRAYNVQVVDIPGSDHFGLLVELGY